MDDHEISVDPVWWPNGSVGREIRCVTCQPNRLLWQSPPEGAYDSSDEFVAGVAEAHRKVIAVDEETREPVTAFDELVPVEPMVLPKPKRPGIPKGGPVSGRKRLAGE